MLNLGDLLSQLLAAPDDRRLHQVLTDYLTDHGHQSQVWVLRRQCPECGGKLGVRTERFAPDADGPGFRIQHHVCKDCGREDQFYYADAELVARRVMRELGYRQCMDWHHYSHTAGWWQWQPRPDCPKCRGSGLEQPF